MFIKILLIIFIVMAFTYIITFADKLENKEDLVLFFVLILLIVVIFNFTKIINFIAHNLK